MAILKTFSGALIGSTSTGYLFGTNYPSDYNYFAFLGQNNYALIEDSIDTTLYLAESTNDSVSLVPFYEKKLPFLNSLKKNVSHDFSSSLLYTNYPRLNAKFNYKNVDTDKEVFSTQIMNHGFNSNLDFDDAYNISNYTKFNIGADTYHLFTVPDRDGIAGGNQSTTTNSFNTAPTTAVILAKGLTLQTAEFITYKSSLYAMNLVSINADEQVIYLKGTSDPVNETSDSEYLNTYAIDRLYALSFNTVANQGVFSFNSLKDLITEGPSDYTTRAFNLGAHATISYLGLDSFNKDCFGVFSNHANSNNQIVIDFLKIDYNQLASATTYTNSASGEYKYLNCFEIHTVLLDADSSVLSDYASQHNVTPSKLYNFDPTTPNQYWFYLPYFKNNGNLALIAVNWDKSELIFADGFTFHYDLLASTQINGGLPGDTSAVCVNPSTIISASPANYAAAYFSQYLPYVTQGQYLHFTFNYIDKSFYDAIYPLRSTLLNKTISFSINTSSPEQLTYQNVSDFPSLNCLPIKNSSNNIEELAVIQPTQLSFYFYSPANAWISSHQEPGTFSEFTLDSYGRRWGIEAPVLSLYTSIIEHYTAMYRSYPVNLHLISQTLPRSTSVEFQNSAIVYSGQNINNNLLVNAYDHQGNRIEADIIVVIEGSNMQFTNGGGTEASATTSANGDTVIPVTITGPGYVNVTVSYNF